MCVNLLEIKNLTLSIRNSSQKDCIVSDISFYIKKNQTIGIVGESASGKTLTALAILQLLPKNIELAKGEIYFKGINISNTQESVIESIRGKSISVIFQNAVTALNPVFKIGVQLVDVVKSHLKVNSTSAKSRIYHLLEQVGLSDIENVYNAYPHQLSGGMAQRVMIAMALSCQPELIIADEPTTALDVTTQKQIISLIKTLRQQYGFSMLLISHDLAVVSQLSDRIIVMRNGQVVENNDVKTIFNQPEDEYTFELIQNSLF